MNQSQAISEKFQQLFLEKDWVTETSFKSQLSDLSWEDAITKIEDFNTIAALTFHINYYLGGILSVLKGGDLEIRDRYSFDLPAIQSQEEWQGMLDKLWEDVAAFVEAVVELPEAQLEAVFVKELYGTYRRNIEAMLGHSYYHLGQIVLIKKMLVSKLST